MKKRIVSFVLVLLLMVNLAACGGGGGTAPNQGAENEGYQTLEEAGYVFVPAFIPVRAAATGMEVIGILGDTIYLRYRLMQEMTEEVFYAEAEAMIPASGIATMRTDGTGFQSIWTGYSGRWMEEETEHFAHEDVVLATVTENGIVLMVMYRGSGTAGEEFTFSENYSLIRITPDGVASAPIDLNAMFGVDEAEEGFGVHWQILNLHALSDGRILLGKHDALHVLNGDTLQLERSIPWEAAGFQVTRNDEILLTNWDDETSNNLSWLFDLETGARIGEEALLSVPFHGASTGTTYDLYLTTAQAVYGFDVEDRALTQLFTWMALDMLETGRVVPDANGDLFFFEFSWHHEAGEVDSTLVHLEKRALSDVQAQTVLTFGTLGLDWDLRREIVAFNRANPNYRIEIREYWDWMSNETREDAVRRFNADMITGNVPDIIDFSLIPYTQYARRGFLADLGALLERDASLDRSDFDENVFRLLEIGGTLYAVAPQFSVQTLVGATELVGNEMGWTMAAFQEAVAALPEGGTAFMDHVTREFFLRSLFEVNLGAFIDYETGRANFDSDLFRAYLEFAKTIPTDAERWDPDFGVSSPGDLVRPLPAYADGVEVEEYDGAIEIEPPIADIGPDTWQNPLATGQALLTEYALWNFMDHAHASEIFEREVTFVGYPSDSGIGSVLVPRTLLAISANSNHPEAAWSFVRTILTEEFQRENAFGFATNLNIQAEQIESARNSGENADPMQPYVSEEGILSVLALIAALDRVQTTDLTMIEIIEEELLPFFAGDRSVDETVRIIQSRAQTYLSERS